MSTPSLPKRLTSMDPTQESRLTIVVTFLCLYRLSFVRALRRLFFLHVPLSLVPFLMCPNYFLATLQATMARFRRRPWPPLLLGKVPSGGAMVP